MDIEPSDAMQRSSSAPDLRVLIDGLKPRLPGTRMEGLALPQMSSLATALVPFKAPQVSLQLTVLWTALMNSPTRNNVRTASYRHLRLPHSQSIPMQPEILLRNRRLSWL